MLGAVLAPVLHLAESPVARVAGPSIRLGSLEFLGAAEISRQPPAGALAPVGGLSDLGWDAATGSFLAVSDDRAERGPARLYRIEIPRDFTRIATGDVRVVEEIPLLLPGGRPFPRDSVDLEGLDVREDRIYLSSEGVASSGADPWVAAFSRSGEQLERLPVPSWFLPRGERQGIRSNLGFEALGLSPDGKQLYAGIENALLQDGPEAGPGARSSVRILKWDLARPETPREYWVEVEGVDVPAPKSGAFRTNGLVALLPLSEVELLLLERQYVDSSGHQIKLYRVWLEDSAEVTGKRQLDPRDARPARKEFLLDLRSLGVEVDNFEGLSWGPRLPDGRRTLWLIADDNFNPAQQRSWILALAWDEEPVSIARIQGASHRSPLEGRWVFDVEGVVTAVLEEERRSGFFLESAEPDGDPATSEGLFVAGISRLPRVGDSLRLHGRVEERRANERLLSSTTLLATSLQAARARTLPPPVSWSPARGEAILEDDGLTRFEPEQDLLDRYESLEGMRLLLPGGIVTGPTSRHREIVLWPEGSWEGVGRTWRNGLLRTKTGAPAGRWILSGRLLGPLPELGVGARLEGPVEGIVDYDFSAFRLLLTSPLRPRDAPALVCFDPTRLRGARSSWTLGSLNVENLSAVSSSEKFRRLAEVVVRQMGSPHVLALQEIQDDSGPEDDDVVTSARTLDRFRRSILDSGGPRYQAVWIDPERNREGGQPGGNIRVAVLVDPAVVRPVLRGKAGPLDGAVPALLSGRLGLSPSPGRVAPGSPAFTLDQGEGVRRSLALELERNGEPIFLVVNHLSSKLGDDRDHGARQPPRRLTEALRLAQVRELRAFAEALLDLDQRARIAFVGDLNDFETSEAIESLAARPFENLMVRLPPAERYTYNFEGVSQVLDHVIVSPELARGAAIDAIHVHSDCPEARRASDHDPLVVRFLDPDRPGSRRNENRRRP